MLTINAEVRKKTGKGESRRLRIFNEFPAIIYGGYEDIILIKIHQNFILQIQNIKNFYEEIFNIIIDGKQNKVKIQEVQLHPFKLKIVHIDFIRVERSLTNIS